MASHGRTQTYNIRGGKLYSASIIRTAFVGGASIRRIGGWISGIARPRSSAIARILFSRSMIRDLIACTVSFDGASERGASRSLYRLNTFASLS
ncbi:MAG: hypothetical protein PSV22_25375, partial [Pseudolabrys sp.]|nr:hypothetical protein [Pseudolabrys sp.]